MEITGILVKQTSLKEGVSKTNGNPWKIAEYLVEVPGMYPKHICFSVRDGQVGRVAHFDSFIGKTVTVSFEIDAREYQGRWFNEINAFGIKEYLTENTRQANIAAANGTEAGKPEADASGTAAAGGTGAATGTKDSKEGEAKKNDLPF